MKSKYFLAAAVFAVTAPLTQAQVVIESGFQDEEDVIESNEVVQRPSNNVRRRAVVQQQTVIQQPTTYVEAAPLAESRADQMRKQRQDVEVQTEQKIVEKLEESRLKDEKDRADRLFGNRLNDVVQDAPPTYQSTQPVQQVVTPVYAAPAPQVEVIQETKSQDLDGMKAEIIQSIKELKEEEEVEEAPQAQFYISGSLGTVGYMDASNIDGNFGSGFSVGTLLPNNVSVEAAFMYSNYYVQEYWKFNPFKEMDQYNVGLAVKYNLPLNMFRPYAGAMVNYTYRKYSDRVVSNPYGYNQYNNQGSNFNSEANSNAVDMGLIIGLDVDISSGIAVGAEYRYSMNMINKTNNDIFRQDYLAPGNTSPVEELSYDSLMLTGKIKF